MSTDDAARFVLARLAELEQRANALFDATRIPDRIPNFTSAGGPAAEAFWRDVDPLFILAAVKAMRAIIEDTWGGPDHEDMWREHVRQLASIWDKHPDHRPEEWWPASRLAQLLAPVTEAEVQRGCLYGWCINGCTALDARTENGDLQRFCPSCGLVQ